MIMKNEAKVIHHIGIVSGICEKIGLVKIVNELIPVSNQAKLSMGTRVKAMVLNALGFTGRPMHLTSEFFRTKPIGLLLGKDISADDINDDALGRALDAIYEKGPESVFLKIVSSAVSIYKINTKQCHLDTTSVSVQGNYDGEGNDLIRFGHSKDFRKDLKQFMMSSFMTSDGNIPLIGNMLPGNTSDKTHFKELLQELKNGKLINQDDFTVVFDSAGYTKDIIAMMGSNKWVSRVPETIDAAKVMKINSNDKVACEINNNYSFCEKDVEYAGVMQRWFLFSSKQALDRETKTIKRSVKREKNDLKITIARFSKQIFTCKDDAFKAVEALSKKLKFHSLKISEFDEEKCYLKLGKPKKDDPFESKFKAIVDISEETDRIKEKIRHAGKFIIATNQLDREKSDGEKALKTYKDQQGVERGFRFLKNPISLVKSVYLKNHDRIVALGMIMFLTLLIYALAERALRKALVEHNETVKSQSKKDVKNPTMRWIFQKMEDIIVLESSIKGNVITQILNMTEEVKKILRLLGSECMIAYGISP
jgi:transposase